MMDAGIKAMLEELNDVPRLMELVRIEERRRLIALLADARDLARDPVRNKGRLDNLAAELDQILGPFEATT